MCLLLFSIFVLSQTFPSELCMMNSSWLGSDVVKIIYLAKCALWAGLIDKLWSLSWRTAFTHIKPIGGSARVCVCVCERERERERERHESMRLWEAVNWVGNLNKLEGEIMGWVCLNFVGLFGFRFELGSKCFKFKHNFSKSNFIAKQTPTTKKGAAQSSK